MMKSLIKAIFIISNCFVANCFALDDIAETVQTTAENVYNKCSEMATHDYNSSVLQGNIEDVANERKKQECLKEYIFEFAKKNLKTSELQNFKSVLNESIRATSSVYKTLIFCRNDIDEIWCQDGYKKDTSLGKLLQEKAVTAELMKILTSLIESTKGGLDF